MSKKKTLFISLSILLGTALVLVIIFVSEPTAKQESAAKETAMLVDVRTAVKGSYQPVFVTTGTVKPVRDIVLSPRIGGEIISRSEKFNPGETVKKGTLLLRIDPADYENILRMRESDLNQALADLTLEKGRQEVARMDYEQSGQHLSEENKALVLRIPQMNTARSNVEAARAAVEQARLDLSRTAVRAPFDAQILSRDVDVGSHVSVGEALGRLVGIDEYWVEATVPQSRIKWLTFADEKTANGAEVRIRNRSAWKEDEFRTGLLYRMIGTLNEDTRLVRVLIVVKDPLGQKLPSASRLSLMAGSFVETGIIGKEVHDVIRLNRDYVRKGQTVWVMVDGKLDIREVDILLTDAEYAYISKGIEDGEQIVTTNLATVVDGAPLRLEENAGN
jgi:RND family efflux transporter MFP subunit